MRTNPEAPPGFINIKVEELTGDQPFDRLDRFISQNELRALSDQFKLIPAFDHLIYNDEEPIEPEYASCDQGLRVVWPGGSDAPPEVVYFGFPFTPEHLLSAPRRA